MIWYNFGPIRTSGSIVSMLTLHSLTGTLKGPSYFGIVSCNSQTQLSPMKHTEMVGRKLKVSPKLTISGRASTRMTPSTP